MNKLQFNISITLENALSAPHTVRVEAESEQAALEQFFSHSTPFIKTIKDDYVNLNKMLWFSIKEIK